MKKRFRDVRHAQGVFNRNTGLRALAAYDYLRKHGVAVSLRELQERQGVISKQSGTQASA